MRIGWWVFALISGCVGEPPPVQTSECGHGAPAAVVTTTDFAVGSLATVCLGTFDVADELAPTSGDPVVRVQGDRVVQINRLGTDSLRVYPAGGPFTQPTLEIPFAPGSNPHDAVVVGDAVLVSLYDDGVIVVHDVNEGYRLGTVDLSAFDDGDGSSEPHQLEWVEGYLYVGLQRFDRDAAWMPSTGRLVQVDPETYEVSASWETGPSPTIHVSSAHPGSLWVRTGEWFELDGEIRRFTPISGLSDPWLREADLGFELADMVDDASGNALVTGYRPEKGDHLALCGPVDGAPLKVVLDTTSSLSEVGASRGMGVVVSRAGWEDLEAAGGLLFFDMNDCSPLNDGELVQFSLDPFSVGFW